MNMLNLRGRITKEGKIEAEISVEFPRGEVDIQLSVRAAVESWTDEEIQNILSPEVPRTTIQEMLAWLEANPPTEPWGDMRDDEDAGDYVHRMRRADIIQLDEPDEAL